MEVFFMRVFMAASPLLMLFLGFTMLSGEQLPRMFVLSNYCHSVSEMVQHTTFDIITLHTFMA